MRPRYSLLIAAVVLAGATTLFVGLREHERLGNTPIAAPALPLEAPAPAGTEAPLEAASTTEATPAAAAAAGSASAAPAPAIAERAATAAALKGALVNIICITREGSQYHSISASGVFITASGYILTSAHVAAYYLLPPSEISCVLRTGSPAQTAYRATLVYIPPPWVAKNAHLLLEHAPQDTGEYDFAILAVSESATGAPLPASFPHVPLARGQVAARTPAVVGSYGAQDLSLSQIASALSPTLAASSVRQLLTFGSTTPDILLMNGSAVAQEGSSGGGVANLSGELIGSITTSAISGTIASRTLSALSAPYIRREYLIETGLPLDTLLTLPPATAEALFAPHLPTLTAELMGGGA